jgi:murein DD-endopeptidase MepM/ murein hydrolase activator NlpD
MHLHSLEQRECDRQGCGYWQASRGPRKHNGVDMACDVGTPIYSPVSGKVTKIGFPYGASDKHHIRYVQVENNEYSFRVFYVDPMVVLNQEVTMSTIIGKSQELGCFYNGITEHVHFEIKDKHGNYVDPNPFLIARKG